MAEADGDEPNGTRRMTLRKALCASPLAILVAVLSHFAAFGFSHMPGTAHAADLLAALAAGLGLAIVVPFVSGFSRRERSAEKTVWYAPLVLAAAGLSAFGAIEAGEGHFSLVALAQATCAAIPLAYTTAFLARRAVRAARSAGTCAGDFIRRDARAAARAVIVLGRASRKTIARALCIYGPRPGRAPPLSL